MSKSLTSYRQACGALIALAFSGMAAIPGASLAQTKQDPDYQAGLAAWQEGRYAKASEHLSRYRLTVLYGRSYDIDYLLGTAWCRLPGMAAQGADLLAWAMQQEMSPAAARQFRQELSRCRDRIAREKAAALAASTASAVSAAPAAVPQPELLVRTSVGAGASIRASGKMFYVVGGDKGAFASYPLEIVKPMPEAVFESRLFPLDATEAATQAARQRFGKGYTVLPAGRFLMGSPSHSEADLRRVATRLENFARFLEQAYGIRFAPRYINVNLAPTPDKLVEVALKQHGLRASPMTLGYTFQNDLSVNAVMQTTAAGTLLHELFHLGVRATFGDIPSWLDESMASLYETSVESDGRYFGSPNWRGDVVRQMGWGRSFRLADLVGHLSDDRVRHERSRGGDQLEAVAQNDDAAYEAAVGRYFALYLQEQDQLQAVYRLFKDRPAWTVGMPVADASVAMIEKATGKPAARIEADFLAWLKEATKHKNWQSNKVAGARQDVREIVKEIPPPLLNASPPDR